MRVKDKIYRAIVLSTLLYGGLHDTTSAFDHEDNLDGQSDKQENTRTDRAAIYGRSSGQKESPVDWTPHEDVTRQLPKQVLYSQLSSGDRKRGRPRLRFKDTIKRNVKLRDIKTDSWTSLSQQRCKWRVIVR
ncbi:hypothetical protein NP493_75g07000 [Ridgeia piscesae]|uniref:Uncharacterized protein n=1 Tax=Ridgeia piscesae TaxID=27915 RepID=A0AAD9UIL5_RIDPI|nr:hypothetical protein NP493_75g07000 [Ridgeia piscesae]